MIASKILYAAGLVAIASASLQAEPVKTANESVDATIVQPTMKAVAKSANTFPLQMGSASGGLPFEMDNTSPTGGEPSTTGNEWVVVPIPFTSSLLGLGIAGGAAYIYHPKDSDKTTPPWTTGVGLFYTESKSWGVALGHKMNLYQDSCRLTAMAGFGHVNYDFYGIGAAAGGDGKVVSLSQKVEGVKTEGLFRVRKYLYAGLNYSLSQIVTTYSGNNLPPAINEIVSNGQLDTLLSIPALRLQWDSRDNSFLPTSGWLLDGEAAFSGEKFGSDYNFQAVTLSAKHYWGLSPTQSVAAYAFGRFAYGDVPFFALSTIGAKGNLRGYSSGRYQDMMVLTGQVEYRWQVWKRFGVVAFGGVGAVAPDLNGFTNTTALPSVGLGLRYLLTESNKINFRVDVSWGKDERLLYIGVGEGF